ncbi:MAG TPA: EAL domain-containing protein, partial [Acidimicrobiales bacterium]|nr:EAL domain-containing protein [Acidimicrobiales bacterium]
ILTVEALLRWPHPDLGMIPPLKFLPLAEDAGLMGPLTAWVLNEAVAQCARWRDADTDVCVAVNVSTTNLLEDGFVDMVVDVLARHGLPASQLVIEITESTIITNFELSQFVIERLRDLGIVVSIDDFGAGERPLKYLASLALGELKLDRPFIADLTADESQRTLVRAAINFAHELGLRVVAEGIEDVATLELVEEMGCDLAQGYYISRPAPADQLSFRTGREAVVGAD